LRRGWSHPCGEGAAHLLVIGRRRCGIIGIIIGHLTPLRRRRRRRTAPSPRRSEDRRRFGRPLLLARRLPPAHLAGAVRRTVIGRVRHARIESSQRRYRNGSVSSIEFASFACAGFLYVLVFQRERIANDCAGYPSRSAFPWMHTESAIGCWIFEVCHGFIACGFDF
jgi:hypothetical protein